MPRRSPAVPPRNRRLLAACLAACLAAAACVPAGRAFGRHQSVVFDDARTRGPAATLRPGGNLVPFIVVPSFGQPGSPLQRSPTCPRPFLADKPFTPPLDAYNGKPDAASYFGHPNPQQTNPDCGCGFGRAFALPDRGRPTGGTAPSLLIALRTDARPPAGAAAANSSAAATPAVAASLPPAADSSQPNPAVPVAVVLLATPAAGGGRIVSTASTTPATGPVVALVGPGLAAGTRPATQPGTGLAAAVGVDDSRHNLAYLPSPRPPAPR